MKITFVGTSSGMAAEKRAFSCLHIEAGNRVRLVDIGEGTARQLVRLGLAQAAIREVFVSHMHVDHAAGLMGLLTYMHLSGRTDSLSVYIPSIAAEAMERILSAFRIEKERWRFKIQILPMWNEQSIQCDGFEVLPLASGHLPAGESFSFILKENEKRCIYTSDVDGLEHLADYAQRADLMIAECTHIPVSESLDFAKRHGIKRILFTHVPGKMDRSSPKTRLVIEEKSVAFARDGDAVLI